MTTFSFDEDAASAADNVSSRIDTSAAYVGRITMANTIEAKTGATGMHIEFESPGGGSAAFDLYTEKDGKQVFGANHVNAIMAVLGLRSLESKPGKHEAWVDGKREEVDGEVFPALIDKEIGFVLQKEKYTKQDKTDGFRMGLYGTFHPVSRLTASEIKERATKPEKLEKMLRGLKDKDKREARTEEPAHPAVGADAGSY